MRLLLLSLFLLAAFIPVDAQTNCVFETSETSTDNICSSMVWCNCKFHYPKEALEKEIQGRIRVYLETDSDCNQTKLELRNSLGYGLDEIAKEYGRQFLIYLKSKTDKTCI